MRRSSAVSVGSSGLELIASTPTEVSVKDWWKGVFVDDNDEPIPGTELVYIMPFKGGFAGEVKVTCELPSKRVWVRPPADYVPPKPQRARSS